MAMSLETLASEAMQLSLAERRLLLRKLAISLDNEPDDTAEAIAQAWDEEIDRRIDDMDAGRTKWISGDEAFDRINARTREAKDAHTAWPFRRSTRRL